MEDMERLMNVKVGAAEAPDHIGEALQQHAAGICATRALAVMVEVEGGVAHGCRGNSEVVALYVLFMLREEPMQPSSVVDRLVGTRGRREHDLIVGRL